MQYNTVLNVKGIVNLSNIGYQYDSEDKEIILESGSQYLVYTDIGNGFVVQDLVDLTKKEETNNAV